MKTSSVVAVVVVIVVIAGAVWWIVAQSGNAAVNPYSTATTTPTTDQTSADTSGSAVLQSSSNATLGSYLVVPSTGMTLYTYSPDTAGVSNCTGQCAVNWPPYTVSAGVSLLASAGLTGQIGTLVRADGTTQVTYNGAPLYTYIKDVNPGDTVGQGVGGVWFVAKP